MHNPRRRPPSAPSRAGGLLSGVRLGVRLSVLLPVLLGTLAVRVLAEEGVGAEEGSAAAWRDQTLLERRLAEAVTAVEEACGAKFDKAPTVRVSTAREVAEVLKVEVGAQIGALEGGGDGNRTLSLMSSMLLAKYDHAARVIHVVPVNVEKMAEALESPDLLTEDVLRVILAHEATHALDFSRFPLEEVRAGRTTAEGMLAYGAAVEGHAQLIAERVSAAWGLNAAFAAYTRTITATPKGMEPAQKMVADALAAQVGFGYVKGAAFLKAIEAARGRVGVEAALRAPPASVREVERPELWLDPAAHGAALDAASVFASLAKAAEATSKGWRRQTAPILVSAIESQLSLLPEEERREAVEGFEDGQVLLVTRGSDRMVVGFLGRFATPEAAARFDARNAAVMRKKDEVMATGAVRIAEATYAEGLGTDGAHTGLRATKTVAQGENRQVLRVYLAHVGRHVLEVTVVNVPALSNETIDAALDDVMAAVKAL